ncbi:MAG: hypothetical protein NZL89_02625, partial [Leptospiraceae bacterium]|nr:hypothetical protein [Leptospiraceae bacterium]
GKLSDTSALFAAWAELPKDFVFLDWGFVLPELPADFGALRKREQVWSLFSALQRRLFLRHFRDRAQVLAPGDAASFARLADAWLLGKEYPTLPPVSASSGQLIFADDERALVYAPDRRKRTVLTVLRSSPEKLQFMPGEVVWLFGYAQLWASRFPDSVVLQAAPLFARCEDCKRAQRTPARLLATSSSLWQKTVAELAALYTLSQPLAAAEPCQTPQDFFRDTLLITGNELFACHIAPENLVVSITESQTRLLPVLLSAAGRKNSAILFIPPQMPEDVRTAVLFDFLLRRTEYNLPPRAALKATQERLKKSFPAEAALAGLRIYAAPE